MYLKAKITGRVTRSTWEYGSISICPLIMKELRIKEFELCIVNGLKSRNNITYVIKGKEGEIGMNGALSSQYKIGDVVHVLVFSNKKKKVREKSTLYN